MIMKKKVGRKGTVHPSSASVIISDPHHLWTLLPAAMLTLTAALSPQDKEVLAYLVSSSSSNKPQKHSNSATTDHHEHPSSFKCDCFRCYMSYWVRWDSSPNRQLIHEIIDAFELHASSLGMLHPKKNKKDPKKRQLGPGFALDKPLQEISTTTSSSTNSGEQVAVAAGGSLRRFMTFFGDRIWGTLRPF